MGDWQTWALGTLVIAYGLVKHHRMQPIFGVALVLAIVVFVETFFEVKP